MFCCTQSIKTSSEVIHVSSPQEHVLIPIIIRPTRANSEQRPMWAKIPESHATAGCHHCQICLPPPLSEPLRVSPAPLPSSEWFGMMSQPWWVLSLNVTPRPPAWPDTTVVTTRPCFVWGRFVSRPLRWLLNFPALIEIFVKLNDISIIRSFSKSKAFLLYSSKARKLVGPKFLPSSFTASHDESVHGFQRIALLAVSGRWPAISGVACLEVPGFSTAIFGVACFAVPGPDHEGFLMFGKVLPHGLCIFMGSPQCLTLFHKMFLELAQVLASLFVHMPVQNSVRLRRWIHRRTGRWRGWWCRSLLRCCFVQACFEVGIRRSQLISTQMR
jgi:hypothetical protein